MECNQGWSCMHPPRQPRLRPPWWKMHARWIEWPASTNTGREPPLVGHSYCLTKLSKGWWEYDFQQCDRGGLKSLANYPSCFILTPGKSGGSMEEGKWDLGSRWKMQLPMSRRHYFLCSCDLSRPFYFISLKLLLFLICKAKMFMTGN